MTAPRPHPTPRRRSTDTPGEALHERPDLDRARDRAREGRSDDEPDTPDADHESA